MEKLNLDITGHRHERRDGHLDQFLLWPDIVVGARGVELHRVGRLAIGGRVGARDRGVLQPRHDKHGRCEEWRARQND